METVSVTLCLFLPRRLTHSHCIYYVVTSLYKVYSFASVEIEQIYQWVKLTQLCLLHAQQGHIYQLFCLTTLHQTLNALE